MGKILISQKLVGINLKIGPLMATGHKPVWYVGPGGNRCAILLIIMCLHSIDKLCFCPLNKSQIKKFSFLTPQMWQLGFQNWSSEIFF